MDVSFWDGKRAPGICDHIKLDAFSNLREMIADAVSRHGDKPAFTGVGETLSFREVDELSNHFAAYLQHHTGLSRVIGSHFKCRTCCNTR